MPFQATVYRVMIGSPGDLGSLRGTVEAEIHAWNGEHAVDRGVVLLPVRWEVDASPRQGVAAQEVVNEDLVRTSDALIALFWTRLGQPTGVDRSGTVEEIRGFVRAGKPCGLFFKKGSMPTEHDAAQYEKLREFQQEVRDPASELKGLAKDFRTATELRTAVARFLTDTVRRLSPDIQKAQGPDDARLAQVEEMARAANAAAAVERLGGDRLLDKDFIRRDMERKACVTVASIGPIKGSGEVTVNLRNEGQYPARDVAVAFDTGHGFPDAPPRPIHPQIDPARAGDDLRRFTARFRVDPPAVDEDGDPIPGQERTVRVRITFRDGLDRQDEAIFVLLLRNRGREWDVEENRSQATLSPLCRHVRPAPPPDRRPPGLQEADHRVVEALVRRAATNPVGFRPSISFHRVGDGGKVLYASDHVSGAPITDDKRPNFTHDRDVLPLLLQRGYLVRGAGDVYLMDESIFRAYGFDPPS